MAETAKVQFYLTNEAIALIEQHAPSQNKRGAWVSSAVVEYVKLLEDTDPTADCGTLEQMAALLRRIERRIIHLESLANNEGTE